MGPTETLKHEHQVILHVLEAAEREVRSIRTSGTVNAELVGKMVDFLRNFADRCHHAKEEKQLFAVMTERGFPQEDGPIAVMLAEHDQGRRHVRQIDEALSKAAGGDGAAVTTVADNLARYSELLRQHIDKEDHVLYVMADQVLTADDQRALTEAFERIEAEEMGAGTHEKYHRLAHELTET